MGAHFSKERRALAHRLRAKGGHQLSLCAAMGFPHARPRN